MNARDRQTQARRAIESLRTGVPNAAAVEALGIDEPAIFDAYRARLEAVAAQSAAVPFFIEGDFGTGKSHVLRFLEMESRKRRMVTSAVTMSKEAPLGDLGAVYRAAVSNLAYPDGRVGGTLAEIFETMNTNSPGYATFYREVSREDGPFDKLFGASVALYEAYRANPELVEQLIEFWDGGPPQITLWNRLLREIGFGTPVRSVAARKLALQRFAFTDLVLRAAGFSGWVVTIDEIELVAKFSLRGRASAYANVSRFAGTTKDGWVQPGTAVFIGAITTDLLGELLVTRADREQLAVMRIDDAERDLALSGLEVLASNQNRVVIRQLDEDGLLDAFRKVQRLYADAYPEFEIDDAFDRSSVRKSMRQNIRSWIGYWDLKRVDATYSPRLVTESLRYDLSEDEALSVDEQASESSEAAV